MTVPQTTPDLFLARRAAAGRSDAWNEIVDQLGGKIYSLAFQFAGAPQDAEDLTQEIFIRLHRGLRRYRGEAPLAAWAMRLSRNLCIDHYRRTRTERRTTFVSEEVLAQIPAAGDPEEDALRRRRIRSVYRALERLTDELAEVLTMRDLQGWSERETAVYLGVPEGTVKSRLHRARHALAGLLRPVTGQEAEEASGC